MGAGAAPAPVIQWKVKMQIKFFAMYRVYTSTNEIDLPFEGDLSGLLHMLSDRYGAQFKKKALAEDGKDIGPDAIILVNGRNVHHLDGIRTKLAQGDVVAIFPIVAGG
jgi:molybdopterin synthase sulfur carrier subunit